MPAMSWGDMYAGRLAENGGYILYNNIHAIPYFSRHENDHFIRRLCVAVHSGQLKTKCNHCSVVFQVKWGI